MPVRDLTQPIRGCGKRTENSFYLGSPEMSEDGVLPAVSEIPPVPIHRKAHRGPLIVAGDRILAHLPEESWYAGSSADTQEKNRADQVAKQTFGMSLAQRLDTGDCKGSKAADEALAAILAKLQWSNRVLDQIRTLTLNKVMEVQPCTLPFTNLIRFAQAYVSEPGLDHLVKLVATTWTLADECPPKKRELVVPTCARILALVGLLKDARDIAVRYPVKK